MDLYQYYSSYNPGVINGPAPGVTCFLRLIGKMLQTCSSQKPVGPINVKFHMEPQWFGGTKSLFAASGSLDQDGLSRTYMVKSL